MKTLAWLPFIAANSAPALRATAVALSFQLVFAVAPLAQEQHVQEQRAGFILWNLPPKDDDAYRRLRDLAGVNESKMLTKTGAEMWAVEPGRVPELRRACDEQ